MNLELIAQHLSTLSGLSWTFQPGGTEPFYHNALTCIDKDGTRLIIFCYNYRSNQPGKQDFHGSLQYPIATGRFMSLSEHLETHTKFKITVSCTKPEHLIAKDLNTRLIPVWVPAFKVAIANYHAAAAHEAKRIAIHDQLVELAQATVPKGRYWKVEVNYNHLVQLHLHELSPDKAEAILKLLSA